MYNILQIAIGTKGKNEVEKENTVCRNDGFSFKGSLERPEEKVKT